MGRYRNQRVAIIQILRETISGSVPGIDGRLHSIKCRKRSGQGLF